LQYKLTADVLFFGSWQGEKVSLLVNGKEIWSQAAVASPGVSASGCGDGNFADSKVSMAVTVEDLQYAGPSTPSQGFRSVAVAPCAARGHCKIGNTVAGTVNWMLRAWPGSRVMRPRRSSVSIMLCTLGGVTRK